MQKINKRGFTQIVNTIITIVIVLTLGVALYPILINATDSIVALGVAGAGLFAILGFLFIVYLFMAVLKSLGKMGGGGYK